MWLGRFEQATLGLTRFRKGSRIWKCLLLPAPIRPQSRCAGAHDELEEAADSSPLRRMRVVRAERRATLHGNTVRRRSASALSRRCRKRHVEPGGSQLGDRRVSRGEEVGKTDRQHLRRRQVHPSRSSSCATSIARWALAEGTPLPPPRLGRSCRPPPAPRPRRVSPSRWRRTAATAEPAAHDCRPSLEGDTATDGSPRVLFSSRRPVVREEPAAAARSPLTAQDRKTHV